MAEKNRSEEENLPNFPFRDYEEFLGALTKDSVRVSVTEHVALGWAESGVESPKMLRWFIRIFIHYPEIISIAFIVFVILQRDWVYLFLTPAVYFSMYILIPIQRFHYPRLRPLVISCLLLLTPLSLILRFPASLTAWLVCELMVWAMAYLICYLPIKYLCSWGFNDRKLFSKFWLSDVVCLHFTNGDRYFLTFKTIAGNIIPYDSNKSVQAEGNQ